jgi:hypothetical protein
MHYLIGVDDTDNLESRGTGHLSRQLAKWLEQNQIGTPLGITRHQLLVDAQIPYTSHNSSACISIETENPGDVWEASCEFLLRESAQGSDVGLCLSAWDAIDKRAMSFGARAKLAVLTMLEAEQTASHAKIQLKGLTGTHGGIIGALSAVGLNRAGNDGRFLWLPGLRELKGKYSVFDICGKSHIDRVCTLSNVDLHSKTIVDVGEWVRPVLRDGKSTLYVEERNHEWLIVPKEYIKKLSN